MYIYGLSCILPDCGYTLEPPQGKMNGAGADTYNEVDDQRHWLMPSGQKKISLKLLMLHPSMIAPRPRWNGVQL